MSRCRGRDEKRAILLHSLREKRKKLVVPVVSAVSRMAENHFDATAAANANGFSRQFTACYSSLSPLLRKLRCRYTLATGLHSKRDAVSTRERIFGSRYSLVHPALATGDLSDRSKFLLLGSISVNMEKPSWYLWKLLLRVGSSNKWTRGKFNNKRRRKCKKPLKFTVKRKNFHTYAFHFAESALPKSVAMNISRAQELYPMYIYIDTFHWNIS